MLQQKQISKILQQGLKPIQFQTPISSTGSIKSISLLSNQGIPLITVSNNSTLGEDYKIYSILGYNSLKNNPHEETETGDADEGKSWTIIEFEKNLKCLICKILDLYLILYYNDDEIPDEYVKIKSDSLISVLYDGLKGYSDD